MIEQSGHTWMGSLMQRLVRWAVLLMILVVAHLLIAALSRSAGDIPETEEAAKNV